MTFGNKKKQKAKPNRVANVPLYKILGLDVKESEKKRSASAEEKVISIDVN